MKYSRWDYLGVLLITAVAFADPIQEKQAMSLFLTSSAFGAGNEMPSIHTCDGSNVSPPLN
jgi:hypothetical protein